MCASSLSVELDKTMCESSSSVELDKTMCEFSSSVELDKTMCEFSSSVELDKTTTHFCRPKTKTRNCYGWVLQKQKRVTAILTLGSYAFLPLDGRPGHVVF